jgi:dienelactone hydrolase
MATQQKTSDYLAQPSGSCCLTGHLHNGQPLGKFSEVANVTTYITHPPSGKSNGHILLYFADVFGMFTNGLLVMDAFAAAGYLTVGLDYFNGDPVYLHREDGKWTDQSQTFEQWLAKYQAVAEGYIPKWIEAIKAQFGNQDTKYACVGYCFGAPYVCESLSPGPNSEPPICSAGAFAHPAFLKERHFTNLKAPLFLSCAETDHTFGTEFRNRAVDLLSEGGKEYQVQLFSGISHGFALRCNLEVPYEKMVKERSLEGMVAWFDFWLGSAGEGGKVGARI